MTKLDGQGALYLLSLLFQRNNYKWASPYLAFYMDLGDHVQSPVLKEEVLYQLSCPPSPLANYLTSQGPSSILAPMDVVGPPQRLILRNQLDTDLKVTDMW